MIYVKALESGRSGNRNYRLFQLKPKQRIYNALHGSRLKAQGSFIFVGNIKVSITRTSDKQINNVAKPWTIAMVI